MMNCERLEASLERDWELNRPVGTGRAQVNSSRRSDDSRDSLVSRSPSLPAEIVAHLDHCDDCQRRVAAHRRLFEGLHAMETPALPPDFAASVLARYRAEVSTEIRPSRSQEFSVRPRWSARMVTFVAYTSAVVLLAAFTLLWRGPESFVRVDPDAEVAATTVERGGQSAESKTGQSVSGGAPNQGAGGSQLSADGNQTPVSRKKEWNPASEMQSVAMFLLSPPDLKTVVVFVNRRFLDLVGNPAKRVEQLPGSLRQVARSVNVTFDLLRHALPGGQMDAASDGQTPAPSLDPPAAPSDPPAAERQNLGASSMGGRISLA